MDLSHRKQGSKDEQDVWIRALPLPVLNGAILETLAKSRSTTSIQQVSIAKFLLGELAAAQSFNKDCQLSNFGDLMEEELVDRYLEIFNVLFQRIVDNEQWQSEIKTNLIALVRQHCDEGSIDFKGSRVMEMLVKTTTAEEIKEMVLNALTHPNDEVELQKLLCACSPSVSRSFLQAMDYLWDIFQRSHFHPTIMSFTRHFFISLQTKYGDVFIKMYPSALLPIFLVHELLKTFISDKAALEDSCRRRVENEVLCLLNETYDQRNLDNLRASQYGFDEGLISFYIAVSCPAFLPMLQKNYDDGTISFQFHPHLWLYLRSKSKWHCVSPSRS